MSRLRMRFSGLSENNRIVIKNITGAFLVKGGALVISLFTMPAYLRYFNDEVALGLWFTLLSVLSWILNFDLGIGNGLRNHLADALAKGQKDEAKKYLSSAYVSVGFLCVAVTIVFLGVYKFINWNTVFNIGTNIVSKEALLRAVAIVFIGIILQLFFKLITSVLYAMQMSSINNLLTLISSLITLICVLLIPSADNDRNLICMAYVNTVAVILPLLVVTFILFCSSKLRDCVPSIKSFGMTHAKAVLFLGGEFLLVQIVYMVIMSTNEYLITFLYGNEAVTEYQIYHKLFSLGGTVFSLALTPVWSIVTKAQAQKDFVWIKKLYRVLLIFSGVGIIIEFLLVPFLQVFINFWLGSQAIQVNFWYGFAFAVLGGLMILNGSLSSIANGTGRLRSQAICFTIGAIVKIPLAWLIVKISGSWIGVVWANVISMGIYCAVQPVVLNRQLTIKNKE